MPGAASERRAFCDVRVGFHETIGIEIFTNLSGCSVNTNPHSPEQGSASLSQKQKNIHDH
jgi:hypothetical protein